MAGPTSPEAEGPTFAPPPVPPGWIAQWDGTSKKYYFVQLATGVSQWETPMEAALVGSTPAGNVDHPYGVPGAIKAAVAAVAEGNAQLITHPDGTQTVKYADGRMEPLMPGDGHGQRALETGGQQAEERGLGGMIGNAVINKLSGRLSSSQHGSPSSGGLNMLLDGLTHSTSSGGGSSSSGQHMSSATGGIGGKLASQLASNLFSSGNKQQQAQSYHGASSAQPAHSGGIPGSVMGGVSSYLGGSQHGSSQNYGYSNNNQSGGYSGQAPPASYQPSAYGQRPQHGQYSQHGAGNHSFQTQTPTYQGQGSTSSYAAQPNAPSYQHHQNSTPPCQPHQQGTPPSYTQQPGSSSFPRPPQTSTPSHTPQSGTPTYTHHPQGKQAYPYGQPGPGQPYPGMYGAQPNQPASHMPPYPGGGGPSQAHHVGGSFYAAPQQQHNPLGGGGNFKSPYPVTPSSQPVHGGGMYGVQAEAYPGHQHQANAEQYQQQQGYGKRYE